MTAFKVAHIMVWMVLFSLSSTATEYRLRGQLSAYGTGFFDQDHSAGQLGVRYIPRLALHTPRQNQYQWELEAALNNYANTQADPAFRAKLYRLKLRLATRRWELRGGLQKINFGPAQLLRSLMWFDRLDPRDPLGMTAGVWGVLTRYYTLNNTNVWLWGLYGNQDPKGLEAFPTGEEKPEYGGRLQLPVPSGEVALTLHRRTVDTGLQQFKESRYALDGRWDIVIGVWFEAVQFNRAVELAQLPDQTMTIGSDYTFGIGNGLYVVGEHMLNRYYDDFLHTRDMIHVSALMANYPLGIFDNLTVIGFYAWETADFYQFFSWQRTYDNLILNLALFHYPRSQATAPTGQIGTGYGAQIMLIYNH